MTAIPYENHSNDESACMQVWRCESCHCIHLRAGQVLLTFTQEEFTAFTQEVVACYCGEMVLEARDGAEQAKSPIFQFISEAMH